MYCKTYVIKISFAVSKLEDLKFKLRTPRMPSLTQEFWTEKDLQEFLKEVERYGIRAYIRESFLNTSLRVVCVMRLLWRWR